MKALLLDGSAANDEFGARTCTALKFQLKAFGWDSEHIILRDKKIGNCSGDFFCWIRTPGMCNLNDDNRIIADAILSSDLLIYLTPVTFGGYASELKRIVDHQIQNISPFFVSIEGETHHRKRYSKYPDFMVLGWMEKPDQTAEAIFRNLVQRNAINFYADTFVSEVILTNLSDRQLASITQKRLIELIGGQSTLPNQLPAEVFKSNEGIPVKRALLLVGSPRNQKSNSNSLGTYLFDRLNARGIRTEIIYCYKLLRSSDRMEELIDAVNSADLVVLAFPLYVDSLPAPLIGVLEHIASARKGRETGNQFFASIANCGFPEAAHTKIALRICESFAQQAGFEWAGSLSLGGGEVIGGIPLVQGGGRTFRIRKSLNLAAKALAMGKAIPKQAQDIMEKPFIPHWVYRLMGGMGWKKKAKDYGVLESLNNQPYQRKI